MPPKQEKTMIRFVADKEIYAAVIDEIIPNAYNAYGFSDIGLAHKEWTWRSILNRLASRFRAVVFIEGKHFLLPQRLLWSSQSA